MNCLSERQMEHTDEFLRKIKNTTNLRKGC